MFSCSIVKAELCAVSALISIGSVLGKTNPVQLTLIALLEVTGFALNEWLLQTLLKVRFCSENLQYTCMLNLQWKDLKLYPKVRFLQQLIYFEHILYKRL